MSNRTNKTFLVEMERTVRQTAWAQIQAISKDRAGVCAAKMANDPLSQVAMGDNDWCNENTQAVTAITIVPLNDDFAMARSKLPLAIDISSARCRMASASSVK